MTALRRRTPQAPRFSRRWWLGGAHNLLWVALISVLIWVYADIEYTDTDTLTATLTLHTGMSENIVLLSPHDHNVTFRISGSQASLNEFRRKLTDQGSALRRDISQDFPPGRRTVLTEELLEKAANLKNLGLKVVASQPTSLNLHLDTMVRVIDVPVDLDFTGAKLETTPAPRTVDILVAQSQKKDLPQPLRLKTKRVDLSTLSPDETKTITAEILRDVNGAAIQPIPPQATFAVQIIRPVQPEEIPVTVQILTPAIWGEEKDTTWRDYVLVKNPASDWRPTLTLVGAKKDLLAENVTAYIRLTDDDKKPVESWLERDILVTFPSGVKLELQGMAPKVQFRLEKRAKLLPLTP
jgi:hypothetical protein